jgi:hypothetical protein
MADAGTLALKAYLVQVRKVAWQLRVAGLVIVALGMVGIVVNSRGGGALTTELGKSAVAMTMIGWVCLIIAVMKRSAWVKAHPFVEPGSASSETLQDLK